MGKTRRSGNYCCVPGCCFDGDVSKIKFYKFPMRVHNLEKRAKWIKALKRLNADGSPWQPSSRSCICSQHFVGGAKSEHPHSPAYIPTIFPEAYYGKQKKTTEVQLQARNRFTRALRRNLNPNSFEIEETKLADMKACDAVPNKNIDTHPDSLDIMQPDEPKFCDATTQIDFYEEEVNSTTINMFSIIRERGETCETGTQSEISIKKSEKKIIILKKTADKGCGPTIQYADKQVGPNPLDENDSCIANQQGFRGFPSIKDEKALIDLAGVSFGGFKLLLEAAGDCFTGLTSKDNMLLIFLIKMKLGLTYSSIGVLFNIHRTTVSRIFHTYLIHLASSCKNFIQWPSKFANEQTIPNCFKKQFRNCRAIIDCAEFKVEKPPQVSQRIFFYSQYKHEYTVKIVIACSPGGEIIFVSKCFGGHTTDAQITNESGFFNFIDHGDLIMTNKEFPGIDSALDASGKKVVVVMPLSPENGNFTADEVYKNQKIARPTNVIDRIVQRIKTFQITKNLPASDFKHIDNITFMACVIVNLQSSKVSSSDENVE